NSSNSYNQNLVSLSLYSGDGDYGELTSSAIKTIIVKNNGDTSDNISPVISGTNGPDFSVIYQNGCSAIGPNKRCTVKVTFDGRNKAPGLYQASLDFSSYL